jgi:molecular chaperone GrpE
MSSHDKLPPIEIVEAEVIEDELHDDAPSAAKLGLELPDDPQQAIDFLLGELATARGEADAYLDDLRRVAADFDNYRKRSQREQAGLVDRAAERVVKELLPVLDSLDAALAIEAQTETEKKLLGGIRSTQTQLLEALSREGLQVIPTWQEPFDPSLHEAVTGPPTGDGPLIISDEYRRGYRLRDRVLRAALVAVERGSTT